VRRTIPVALLSAGALTLTASACGGSSSDGSSGSSGKGKDMKVALAFDVGGRGDQSFNDSAAKGVDEAQKKIGFTTKDFEPSSGESDADKVDRLTQIAENGYDTVITVGFAYAGPLKKVAPKYPKVHFAIIDDASVTGKNITNLVFNEEEGSYLVGVAAALKAKDKNAGFIGGVQTPLIQKFQAGYQQGFKATAPKGKLQEQYLTQLPDISGFADPAKAKVAAQGMIDNSAEVLFAAAGGSGSGMIEKAHDDKVWAIGVDSDQYKQKSLAKYKDSILTSMVKNVDVAVDKYLQSIADGKPETGVVRRGLKEDGVDYSTSGGFVDDIEPQLEKAKKDIIDGRIKVSATVD
jgi:basic membrane protein A